MGGGLQVSQGHAFAWSRFLARQIDLALSGLLSWGALIIAFRVPVMAFFGWTPPAS